VLFGTTIVIESQNSVDDERNSGLRASSKINQVPASGLWGMIEECLMGSYTATFRSRVLLHLRSRNLLRESSQKS
jgi:hypothetical protein